METESSSIETRGSRQLSSSENAIAQNVSFDIADAVLIPDNLPPMDKGSQAWLFCLSASILEMIIWGYGFSFGVFQAWYTSHPPFQTQSPIAISAIGACALGIQYFEGLELMVLIQTRPQWMRPIMWICLSICTACLLLSSFASRLILIQGIVFGMAAGILYFPIIFWLEWFNERRSLAGGLIFGGSGLGGVFFPFIANYLLNTVGFRWTLRIWSGMFAILASFAMLGVKPRIPAHVAVAQSLPFNAQRYLKQFKFVWKPIFVLNVVPTNIQLMIELNDIVSRTGILSSLSPLNVSLVLAVFNLVSVLGQIVIGYMCDKMPYIQVMFFSAIFSAVAAFTLLGLASSLSIIFVFVVIFGSLAGGFSSVWTAAAVETSDGDPGLRAPILLGFGWSRGLAAIVGPIVAGSLYERSRDKESQLYGGHGFIKVTIFVGAMMLVTGLLGVGTAWWRNHR